MIARAFTLVELLVVVAIIAILAAIALPNLQEAQIRSKVSRARSDIRSCVVALETYAVDQNCYPSPTGFDGSAPFFTDTEFTSHQFHGFVPHRLTSPVAYLATAPVDVFEIAHEMDHPKKAPFHYSEQYYNAVGLGVSLYLRGTALQIGVEANPAYMVLSHGPDAKQQDCGCHEADPALYDTTNGTVSIGDSYYFGPGIGF